MYEYLSQNNYCKRINFSNAMYFNLMQIRIHSLTFVNCKFVPNHSCNNCPKFKLKE